MAEGRSILVAGMTEKLFSLYSFFIQITVLVILLCKTVVFLSEKTESFPFHLLTDVVLPDILLKRLGGCGFRIGFSAAEFIYHNS